MQNFPEGNTIRIPFPLGALCDGVVSSPCKKFLVHPFSRIEKSSKCLQITGTDLEGRLVAAPLNCRCGFLFVLFVS